MEIKLGDYGKMMFEIMAGKKDSRLEHWESIRAEAEPLVRQLLALNEKMTLRPGIERSVIIGVLDKSGKKKISNAERVHIAQEQLWSVAGADLKEGDLIWICDGELEMDVSDIPDPVETVTKDYIYVDRGRDGTQDQE